ncbi:hypothetical protein GUJ93_ZPchr0012g21322 [Zizania palustris]|uniref:Uncharacterized protein n=1 Tax=Zizania palustris TaxID=103762 RepID=A0A8J6BR72_ZIZPA|nr:hypothetical protein GUJ93_ZPchr0012g21322 [Zizania palustris]
MITVCEVCGELGYKHLLLSCENCNEAAVHRVGVPVQGSGLMQVADPKHRGSLYECEAVPRIEVNRRGGRRALPRRPPG